MNKRARNIAQYSLDDTGQFIVADYNSARPFSSFLPGIAGVNGIPLWVFYVNRGQCLCSMGTQDKDHAIMEFLPANSAYDLVTRHGFRTFVKLPDGAPAAFYEPFQRHYRDHHVKRVQRMIISPSQLTLEELNHTLNLKFTVAYSPVPQDKYAGLIRTLHIQNLGSSPVDLEGLDGLPVIVPYGVDNFALKNMRRTIEAFVEVRNLDRKAPFFKAKVETADRPDVSRITRGNFYVGFEINQAGTELVSPIVDPGKIFGSRTDYSFPERYLDEPAENLVKSQLLECQLPCAMGLFRASIPAGESYTYASIIGHASSLEALNGMLPRLVTRDYVKTKAHANREVIDVLTQHNLICSSKPELDHYARQNFLDNTMRGGFPFTFAGEGSHTTLHLYSRKHGDLERDYNDFCLMPTRYSQGNGNFRDINQNRRSDLLFNPDIGASNVEYFYNLIQLDGFNPLVLKEIHFRADDRDRVCGVLDKFIAPERMQAVAAFLTEPFTPGALLTFLEEHGIGSVDNPDALLGELLNRCRRITVTDHGEGFWVDHWTYNLDLLENYLALYPDKFHDLLFSADRFTFHNSSYRVQPRDYKYVLWEGEVRQLGAVVSDKNKAATTEELSQHRDQVRVHSGKGDVYYTSLFGKILCLIVNKLASLDPEGVGVEMEAGKPGWYDALNGLPGLMGSSLCETLEVKRHILFLMEHLADYEKNHTEVAVFSELAEFMEKLHDLLTGDLSSLEFWDAASKAKEEYRNKTRSGISGEASTVTLARIQEFFAAAIMKLEQGIEKARDPESKTVFTYFHHEVTDYEVIETPHHNGEQKPPAFEDGLVHVRPLKFRQLPLPLFLEGPVHYLRCRPGEKVAREFAAHIKTSALFDKSLKMYKVNASLEDQPMTIGRAKVFSPGWLENESIWLHMEYKYMLELLRNGLYPEFYEDFKNVFIPFLSPDMYGRSILENCSFLASSAHPDPTIHGNGFVARLSGATAEFIHILQLMILGPRPFRVSPEGELQLALMPALPGWLFTSESKTLRLFEEGEWHEIELPPGTFSFMFLGRILVVYHNSVLKDTYGKTGVTPTEWKITDQDGNIRTFDREVLTGTPAVEIRDRSINRIDIKLRKH